MNIEINDEELATILAALRHWQQDKMPGICLWAYTNFKEKEGKELQELEGKFGSSFAGIATNGAEFPPLSEEDIDDLCSTLNTSKNDGTANNSP